MAPPADEAVLSMNFDEVIFTADERFSTLIAPPLIPQLLLKRQSAIEYSPPTPAPSAA